MSASTPAAFAPARQRVDVAPAPRRGLDNSLRNGPRGDPEGPVRILAGQRPVADRPDGAGF